MKRREALSAITILAGGALLTTSGLFQSCNVTDRKRTAITERDAPLLDEIGETIIPTTATSPGAKVSKIWAYMVLTVNDCYTDTQKNIFIEGLNLFDQACMKQYKTQFENLSSTQKKEFLIQLDGEAKANNNEEKSHLPHYFDLLKQLTIEGYFSSEIGMTKALRYEAIPGSYNGCIAANKGDKPWAT